MRTKKKDEKEIRIKMGAASSSVYPKHCDVCLYLTARLDGSVVVF
jgi:hypothetical protein